MAGGRQPIKLLQAKGKKHLTKKEIEQRESSEIKPISDEVIAPSYLSKKQKDNFYEIAAQLKKLKILNETDADAIARYITAHDLYVRAVKQLRKTEVLENPQLLEQWSRMQDRYFKQVRSSANDLGLSISSRCKLVVPVSAEKETKPNKFKRFEKAGD